MANTWCRFTLASSFADGSVIETQSLLVSFLEDLFSAILKNGELLVLPCTFSVLRCSWQDALIYVAENKVQPDVFLPCRETMWWAINTHDCRLWRRVS